MRHFKKSIPVMLFATVFQPFDRRNSELYMIAFVISFFSCNLWNFSLTPFRYKIRSKIKVH